jgi:GT2 family glycosyltransferase
MRAGSARDGVNVVPRLVEGLDATPEGHVSGLAANALCALAADDLLVAWLLADRLVRLTAGVDADALMLRAAALAALGDIEAARCDTQAAARVDPDNALVNRSRLAGSDARLREQALRSLLRQVGEADFAGLGMTALAEGFRAMAHLGCEGGTIAGTIRWTGPASLTIRLDDGLTVSNLSLPSQADLDATPFAHAATLMLPVPDGTDALAMAIEGVRSLVEPEVLRFDRAGHAAPALPSRDDGQAAAPGLMIVVPVYDAFEAVAACFDSLQRAPATLLEARIVAIDDAAPAPGVSALLDALASAGRLTLLRNPLNLGFAGSVNRALTLRRSGEDVLLLNADTIVPPGAIDRLIAAARSDAAIGTVTPLSNTGEDTSLPRRFSANPIPTADDVAAIDALAAAVNRERRVDMPNGVGFCLYVGAAALDRIGRLSQAFGRGYYEDVEFCLRAAAAGFRNICAADVYVGHHGSLSFKGEKRALVRRNLSRLSRSYPDYRQRARDFERADPLQEPIGRLEQAWLAAGPTIDLMVTPPLPLELCRHLAAGLASPDRRMVVMTVTAAAGEFTLSFAAPDGGFPQSIVQAFANEGGAAALDAALAWLAPRMVFSVDPQALPAPLVTWLRRRGWLDRVVLAQSLGALGYTALHPPPSQIIVPTCRMATRIDAAPTGVDLRTLDTRPRATVTHRRAQCLLLIETPLDDEVARSHRDAVLREQRGRGAMFGVCLLGEPPDALRLMAEGSAFATGEMPPEDLDAWLARSEAVALFLNSTGFGMSDPRLDSWLAAGLDVAIFAPGAGGDRAGPLLELDPASAPAETARQLWDWAEARSVRPPGA